MLSYFFKIMKITFIYLICLLSLTAQSKIFINMDSAQSDHLKAYGVVFNSLVDGGTADWLLNYKGGSFVVDYSKKTVLKCRAAGVSFSQISSSDLVDIYSLVQSNEQNTEVIRLEKAPKIAVYVPPGFQPWDDAVTLALEYAEVKYDKIWIEEILRGDLDKYDWLHLHHEDFTGQYGKFYNSFRNAPWYIEQQQLYENEAKRLGFSKVSQMELAVARSIKEYIAGGGFLFAMCSATDSYDIALAAHNTDIAERMYDGDAADPDAQEKLDFSNTLAFENFILEMNPLVYEYRDRKSVV